MNNKNWYTVDNEADIISPSLLVYPARIEANIQKIVERVGTSARLRPHIKTHKMAEIIQMQMKAGINKFKCATIAEAELLAQCGVNDILLAMQPVGKNVSRFFELVKTFPQSEFSTLVDNEETAKAIAELATKKKLTVSVWMDINVGMNRTGIVPDKEAVQLFKKISSTAGLHARGLHVYDGHIRNPDINERSIVCNAAFDSVRELVKEIDSSGVHVESIVAGGTPTFPVHAKHDDVITSPGTCLLWDAGYGDSFKELDFLHAAVLFIRVVSKPTKQLACLDLGHKSVASEMSLPRVKIFGFENCKHISQSEEHLVIEGNGVENLRVGDVAYAIPIHICPTVAKYDSVVTIENGKATGSWRVAARDRKINI